MSLAETGRNNVLAYIALGANQGDARRALEWAIGRLGSFSIDLVLCSSFWQTAPVNCPPGSPPFINAVAALRPLCGETPETLLGRLLGLENECGRRPKKVLNEPRPLDLDLIAFGAERRTTPRLTLPHPRAHQRRFVLQPLNEIAPHLVLPGQTFPVSRLLASLPLDPGMKRVG